MFDTAYRSQLSNICIVPFVASNLPVCYLQLGNDENEDNGPDTTSMASKILTCCGPFVTVRLAQSVFSGHKRPAATLIRRSNGKPDERRLGNSSI